MRNSIQHPKHQLAFSLLELMVVVAIVAILTTVTIPLYQTNIRRVNVATMVNSLGTFKLGLTDTYSATGTWPATLKGTTAGSTSTDTTFADAVNFRYNVLNNKAWLGYQLSTAYGSGWIFLVIVANTDQSFDIHCGSLNSTCTLGYCNSAAYYPSGCSETGLNATYTLE
jgi:prepilin-type N-terminal cleavage/methylation domain-containing protein